MSLTILVISRVWLRGVTISRRLFQRAAGKQVALVTAQGGRLFVRPPSILRNALNKGAFVPIILPGETDIYALTDSRLSLGRPLGDVARQLLDAGIKILQYREKKAPMRRKYADCLLLRRLTEEYGACFIVNDHAELAMLCGADGLHVGQDDVPLPVLKKLAPNLMVGISTHSPEQARQAVGEGADYIGVGPIFATQTKEDVTDPVGYEYLDWVAANISLPFVAIGGIKAHNIAQVAEHGARCCAMVSELVGAEDISARVRAVREEMHKGLMRRKAVMEG